VSQILSVPYFRQRDNISGEGYRECASSSAAMLAAYYKKVTSDDQYNRIRQTFGDTTEVEAHLDALRHLGLSPWFTTEADWDTVAEQLGKGRPCILPYLHHGPVSAPRGGGHWVVAVGLSAQEVIIHDPWGEPLLLAGGHLEGKGGRAVRCTRRNFGRRWMVEGPASGWLLTIQS
jgi:ABC-type bacteriocin/lantibiotic exporter with double-glycine peptidase domain